MSGCFLGLARSAVIDRPGWALTARDSRPTDQAGHSRPGTPAGERGAPEELALASKHWVVHIETLDGCVTHTIQGQDAQIVGAPGEVRVPLVRPRVEQPMLATKDRRLACHEIALEAVAVGAGCGQIRQSVQFLV